MNRPLRVLVADDEPENLEYLKEVFGRLGHQTAAARTGKQLLELAHSTEPDLIVTDIRMPDMDGLEAVEAVNRERETPVILVTAHTDTDLMARAEAQHVMAYLVKPVRQPEVEAAVRVAMARWEAYQAARTEAQTMRQALEDRKILERAKGHVMRRLVVGEEEAYRRMKRLSSHQNRKMLEVAKSVLEAEAVYQQLETV